MVDQLIQLIATKLGIEESLARQATSIVFGLIQKEGNASAISALFEKIPGASDLAAEYEPGGSALGGLIGSVGGMLGGNAGDALSAFAAFKDTGLSADQAKEMLPIVKGFLGENCGEDVMQNALGSMPLFKDLIG